MSPRSLTILALSVCFLLMVANTNAFFIGFPVLPRAVSYNPILNRGGRSEERAVSACCATPSMKWSDLCPIGMECCPGFKKVLHKSGQKKGHFCPIELS